MAALALTCPWCGAPLPNVAPGQPLARCAYCGSTASLTGVRATRAEQHQGAPAAAIPAADPRLQQHVIETFKAARQRGASAHEALALAARERLGPLGESDAFARVCLALVRDFDAEHGTRTADDAACVARMIENYLTAIEEVRTTGAYAINLPFFTATPNGPCHLQRTLTAEVIAELAAREPVAEAREPVAVAREMVAKEKGKEKKRRFWPFG